MATDLNTLLVQAAIRKAKEMVDVSTMPVGKLLWKLARCLKAIRDADTLDIMALKPAFDAFAHTLIEKGDRSSEFATTDQDVLWEEFAYCWGEVEYPEGADATGCIRARQT